MVQDVPLSKSSEILESFKRILKEKDIQNVKVIKTGCFGLCAKGPCCNNKT